MRARCGLAGRGAAALASLGLVVSLMVVGCGGSGRTTSTTSTTSTPSTASTTSTTSTTTPPPPAPAARTATFGTDVDQLFLAQGANAGDENRQLAAAAATGLGVARAAPLWEFTEPRPPAGGVHRYDWHYDDTIAARLAAHGFRWLALLAYAPGWASATPTELHGAPVSASEYAAYAAAVAARYRGRIAAFEIWNEENSGVFWRPVPDPAAYARLYLAARAAIHRVDPGVPVLIGGLANTGSSFLTKLLRLPGLRGQVDGVAVHPYGRDPAEVLGRVRGYRLQLRTLGAGTVPLYVTEYGWATEPVDGRTYATAAQRGPFISAVAQDLLRSDCGVRMVVFYAWTTAQSSPASVDQWYGVASPDGVPNSGTAAVAGAARALETPGAAPVKLCSAG